MSTSPNLGLNLQTTGSNNGTWGVILNGNQSIIDARLGARLIKSVAGSSNIIVTTDEAQNFIMTLTGVLTGNIKYILPAQGGMYFIKNTTTGAFTLTVVNDASGTGVAIAQGTSALVVSNPDTMTVSGTSSTSSSLTVDTLTVNTSISLPSNSVANSALNIGTSANQIVALDGSAKLPAVDGSQLTGLSSAPVTSVAGKIGAVVLSSGDISGLGTAATLNAGSGANQVVQLNGSAALPAVNGSNLTGLNLPVVTNSSTGRIAMGGVTIQWGIGSCGVSSPSNSFGTNFSGTPYSIVATQISSVVNKNDVLIVSYSSSAFTAYNSITASIFWIAIGPT